MRLEQFAERLKLDSALRRDVEQRAKAGTLSPSMECHLLDLAIGKRVRSQKTELLLVAAARLGLVDPLTVSHITNSELVVLGWLLSCKLRKRVSAIEDADDIARFNALIDALDTCFDGELVVP
jgi:hypothetical protein